MTVIPAAASDSSNATTSARPGPSIIAVASSEMSRRGSRARQAAIASLWSSPPESPAVSRSSKPASPTRASKAPTSGRGGIYNFVTKRGACRGVNSKISWTQVETGSAITWKYPSCLLIGDNSVGEFYSVALTNHWQQADTGTKMIHIGKNTTSTIVSKGISAGHGQNTYRGAVKILKSASGARNYSQCDSLL